MRTLLLLVIASPIVAAAQAPTAKDFVVDLELEVGQVRTVTGGPIRNVICDQSGIVDVVSTADGTGFRGLAPGATACSFVTADSVRRTVRAAVTAPKERDGGPTSPPNPK